MSPKPRHPKNRELPLNLYWENARKRFIYKHPKTHRRHSMGQDKRKSQRGSGKRGGRKRHWKWSPALEWAYTRALEIQQRSSIYLLPARHGGPYTPTNWSRKFKKGVIKALEEGELEYEFQLKDLRAMAANESDNPFKLLQHEDGSITLRHYANRRARTTAPIR